MNARTTSGWERIIVHADMDAFYASAEQLDNPELRGKPLLVGPDSDRGVVLTASYEARPFGVGSAMPMAHARRLCPQAIIVAPRFERYQLLSEIIMDVFEDFSPRVEAISLDEAFIDMTGAERLFGPPQRMASAIQHAVTEATGGLTASVGVSTTKYVAKVASGFRKPVGLTLVPGDEARAWLSVLPVARLWGAGKRTQARLHALGFSTIGEIAAADPERLQRELGKAGRHFFELANARDPRTVARRRYAQSIGSDRTLERDVRERKDIETHLHRAADSVGRRLRRKHYLAHGVRVKLKTSSFRLLTRQRRLSEPTDVAGVLHAGAVSLLDRFPYDEPFRLIGLAAFDLARVDSVAQMDLLDVAATDRQRRLEATLDEVSERFGSGAVRRANQIHDGSVLRDAPNLDFIDETPDDD